MFRAEGGNFGDLQGRFDGAFLWTDPAEFMKAVTSGYGTDVATFTGGRAVQLQSIERTLLATIQKPNHFVAFNSMQKSPAIAVSHEYVQQTTVGGFPGDSFNSETGQINENDADYRRRTVSIKYLMTMRTVSVVQQSTRGVVDVIKNQTQAAILQLLSSAEWGIFFGDSSCNDQEFDGIDRFLTSQAPADHIFDARGNGISPAAVEFINAAQLVASYGNYGRLSKAYMSNLVASDLDQKLDPNFRVTLSGNVQDRMKVGAPVAQVVTRWGNIDALADIFIREGDVPFASRNTNLAAIVVSAAVTPPGAVAAVITADASSKFQVAHAGLYTWGAEGGNSKGRSAIVYSDQEQVDAGDIATINITETGGGNESYYMIYRTNRNGSNAVPSNFREQIRVAKAGTGTTTYVDINDRIPGTSTMFLLTQVDDAIEIVRLLPLTKFALYPVNTPTIPWAHLLFLALLVGKPNQHALVRNLLPTTSVWKPF
jgi:hypothetical protein